MFTGIIQDIGTIKRLQRKGDNTEFTVFSDKLAHDIKIGDSVAISGVCLTGSAVDPKANQFVVTAVSETMQRATLGDLTPGAHINLELALQPTDRLGGHFVQGHVDTIGRCSAVLQRAGSWEIRFDFPQEYGRYVVEKGSVAIDGVSLTIYDVKPTQFTASIIPHTWESTTLRLLKAGMRVNLEFDLLAKYIAKMTGLQTTDRITLDRLREYGY
ncbi:MAG: riboflavin synthase [Candidatus Zixiibacteriota bacterium]|nr:MAG: riboflavin synthase [candidate division Zixibacteria bacterium]